MHAKLKGNVGQFAVAAKLAELGYSVFTEEGDLSKIDIVAEKNGKLISFQVKAITPKNGVMTLWTKKSGPNYKFQYERDMFNYFAIYDLVNREVYIVPSEIVETNRSAFNLRIEKTKSNQSVGVNFAQDYTAEKTLGA